MSFQLDTHVTVALLAGEILAIAALGGTRAGGRVGVALSVALLATPFLAAGSALMRAVLATAFLMCFFRARELLGGQLPGFWRRVLHVGAVLDTRRVRRCSPAPFRGILSVLAPLCLTVGALVIIGTVPLPGWLRRLLLGLAVLAAFEFMDRAVRVIARGAGWSLPRISREAHRATSLAEFWGSRWNLVIGGILREHVFAPRSRTPLLALALAFLASGVAHFYLMIPGVGLTSALMMAGFFLVQPPLILAERALSVRAWPRAARHAWTLGALWLAFPLFAVPALQMIGVR